MLLPSTPHRPSCRLSSNDQLSIAQPHILQASAPSSLPGGGSGPAGRRAKISDDASVPRASPRGARIARWSSSRVARGTDVAPRGALRRFARNGGLTVRGRYRAGRPSKIAAVRRGPPMSSWGVRRWRGCLILVDSRRRLGTRSPDHDQRRDLLETVGDPYNACSLLITSQIPVKHWYDIIGSPTPF
jgi:hypothetical protein